MALVLPEPHESAAQDPDGFDGCLATVALTTMLARTRQPCRAGGYRRSSTRSEPTGRAAGYSSDTASALAVDFAILILARRSASLPGHASQERSQLKRGSRTVACAK